MEIKKKKEKIIPVVPYRKFGFEESKYQRSNGDYWMAETLYEFCKKEKYQEFEIPLAGINLNGLFFNLDTMDIFVWQMKRVLDCDLKYPIILDDEGCICDGWHRVCKALLEGKKTIKAIRMLEMPKTDGNESII